MDKNRIHPKNKNSHKFQAKDLYLLLAFSLSYFALAKLGLSFSEYTKNASPIWPAAGFAVGILFVYGLKFWPGILLGAVLTNYTSGNPWSGVTLITLGNILSNVLCVYVLKNIVKNNPQFVK